MATDQIKLFSQFGIEDRSQEQILAEKEQARVAGALANVNPNESFAGENDLEQAGAFLGAMLVNKFKKPELSPEQKRDLAMKEFAQIGVQKKMEEDEQFRADVEANPQLAAIETMRQMSKFAYDSGDVTLAAEISAEAGRRFMDFRQQQAELAKLKEETAGAKEKRVREGQTHRQKLAETTTIVAPNSEGRYSLEDLEGQMITGRYDTEKGFFVDDEGTEIRNFITLEEAISLRELAQEEMTDGGVQDPSGLDWDAKVRLFNSAISGSERTGLRMQFDALDTQSAVMNSIADMFVEMDESGKQPGEFLDGAGRITEFVTDLSDAAKNVGATWNVQIAKGSPEEIAAGKGEAMFNGPKDKGLVEEYGSLVELPEGMSETGDAAAEYRSSIIQLAYAVARSNEPGARQLSDTDFRNAMKEIGTAAASPERLRRVILANFSRKSKQVEQGVQRVAEIGATVGLSEEQAKALVYGTKGREEKLERWNLTMTRFGDLQEELKVMEQSRDLSAQQVREQEGVVAPTITGSGTPDDPIIIE
jgi:hypothetical protein